MKKISNEVLDVLSNGRAEGMKYFLPPTQLDRKLYTDVNKVLESIGGKWDRKSKSHIFNDNVEDILEEVIQTGEYADKKDEIKAYQSYA